MNKQYLFGPVSREFADQNLYQERQAGRCLAFDSSGTNDLTIGPGDSWETVVSGLPAEWRPDAICLQIYYASIPACFWSAPVPIIVLAGDANLLWHSYRRQLPVADFILTDTTTCERLAGAGIRHAASANLFGCERVMLEAGRQNRDRDIDLLFVSNMHAAVQRERMPWLERLARLSERWNVVIRQGVYGAEYRELLSRARIVFNRSVRGECNKRAIESAILGCLLLEETDNREGRRYFSEGECIYYTDDNLEELLDYYLEHETERAAIAEAARRRAQDYSFESLWQRQLGVIDEHWSAITERARNRPRLVGRDLLLARLWQALGGSAAGDPALEADLVAALVGQPRAAWLHQALGVVVALKAQQAGENSGTAAARALPHFQQALACDPLDVMAGLNLTECLAALRKDQEAVAMARRVLAVLEQRSAWERTLLDAGHFPTIYDFFRVEWEQAAWQNPGAPAAEQHTKEQLLRWRLHGILGDLTGDLHHYHEAVTARPDLPTSRAALGCALGRSRRAGEAVGHLQQAVAANPLDLGAARALFEALGEVKDAAGRRRLARSRRLLARAAPQAVPPEGWFAEEPLPQAGGQNVAGGKPLAVVWEGDLLAMHSLALVNREICGRLLARGHDVNFAPARRPAPNSDAVDCPPLLKERLQQCGTRFQSCGEADTIGIVSHQWPPSFEAPAAGHWVIVLPWEFGSLPKAWIAPLRDLVDEIWVPSRFVRDTFIQSGIPADRVQVVPNGVEPARFHPGVPPYPLRTAKKFKFLFVGGAIQRKGIDILLESYTQAFTREDDVCLVIKDMGVGEVYKGQTAGERIAEYQARSAAPEIEYIQDNLRDPQLAGLYTACQCLVHPYRGEGFGLPIAEAMACGLPVMVTGYGAALDYCNDDNAFLIPACVVRYSDKRLSDMETVDYPFQAQPDEAALRSLLRYVVDFPEEAKRRAGAARAYVHGHLTWDRAVNLVEERLRQLKERPIRRRGVQRVDEPIIVAEPRKREKRISLSMIVRNEEDNLPACLESVRELFDEQIIVDTGSTDRTREIALRYGAQVFDFPWVDDFAAARNEAVKHASGDWVFWMDADDRIDAANRQRLAALFADVRDENAAYVMQCLCVADGNGDVGTLVHHVRLFQNRPELRWKYRIHEQVLPALRAIGGATRFTDITIQHTGYVDPAILARKQARDERLLLQSQAEMPNDPFVLFNLSQVYLKQGKPQDALPLLRRSLKLSDSGDSIVRKLYYLIVQAHRRLGERYEAETACRAGRAVYPQDAELLGQDAQMRLEQGDEAGAEACYLELLNGQEAPHFASVPVGLRGFLTRNNLALVYKKQGKWAEAEAQWRQAVQEEPGYLPALLGLEDVFTAQNNWPALESVARHMERLPQGDIEASVTRARGHLGRREFGRAREILTQTIARAPRALRPRVLLSYVLLQEGRDPLAAERALQDVLVLDPEHPDANQNLAALLRQRRPVAQPAVV